MISTFFILIILGLIVFLIKEVNKQQPRRVKQQHRQYHPLAWKIAWISAPLSNAIARFLIYQGIPSFQAYLIPGIPSLLLVLWSISLEPQSPDSKTQSPNAMQQKFISQHGELLSLQKRLLNMVGGETDVAYRLVSLEKSRCGGKPEAWYWQSAIETLIRDRR